MKRLEAIFAEPEMLRSSLGQISKVLNKIKQLKILMAVSLTPNTWGPLNFIECSHGHLATYKT